MRPVTLIAPILFAASAAFAESAPRNWEIEWPATDFAKSSIEFSDVMSGGPPKDGIPALDKVSFAPAPDIVGISEREPVVTVEIEGAEPRTYPIRYLTWHEIVNDKVGEIPLTVTFCPLCNSALVFDGRTDAGVLTFGVSGKLRNSDMIMYDRETESWWQQFTGEAIVGKLLGTELTVIPSWMESYGEFTERHPDGLVMVEPVGFARPYGRNPYERYDGSARPFLYRGELPPHGITRLAEAGEVIEDGLRITWTAGQASALDTSTISEGRDVGSIRVYDAETGAPVAHEVVFAFAFHAFAPEGTWRLGQ